MMTTTEHNTLLTAARASLRRLPPEQRAAAEQRLQDLSELVGAMIDAPLQPPTKKDQQEESR